MTSALFKGERGNHAANRGGREMKYKRWDLTDTLRVASAVSQRDNKPRYVFALAGGYSVEKYPPPFAQAYYIVDRNNVEHRPT
jgi:hypothetical protein